jgi:predicted homoserine dehydrogenase-like protein
MIRKLKALAAEGRSIKVGIIGCGAMGSGVAWQVARTPGMEVAFLGDLKPEALSETAALTGCREVVVENPAAPPDRKTGEVLTTTDPLALLKSLKIDALVECTNSIHEAFHFCRAAIAQKAHVILMNAEVDLVFGPLLAHEARRQGVVVTSDAGDQHGVLATMADEIQLWGFRIVQAGNMKGFLYRHADADHARPWAEKQKGSVIQTVSYTDGSKMNIEQALIGNYLGLTPIKPGMEGPKISDIRDVLDAFDFDKYGDQGRVDFTEGVAWPGGGVYIVGHCDDDRQDFLLNYYKVTAKRPYYLFFRPYHLCHVETPRAIAQCYFESRAVIEPPSTRLNDVYAYAKKDLKPGDTIHHAIGGDEVYSLVDECARAKARDHVPAYLLEAIGGKTATVKKAIAKDQPLRLSDLEIPSTPYHELLAEQARLLGC